MNIIKKIIAEKKLEKFADYFLIHKRIESEKANRKPNTEKTIKVAILSSFTTEGIKEVLNVKCFELGIMPEFYIAPYSQYAQEIINKDSSLYQFKPDLVIVIIDTMSLLGDAFFFPYQLSVEERKNLVDEKYTELRTLITILFENIQGKIIFHNFEVPAYSVLGILENKQDFGFIEMIRKLNSKLQDGTKDSRSVFIFDYELFCSKHGKKDIFNSKMYYLGDIKLDFQFIPFLCEEYMSYIKPLMSLTKKCIVLDLDNTLWGGIIGEDGLEKIKLGPTPEGRPFFEFQKHLLNLFERGVVLAINSRNNLDETLRVFREHPYMVLKEEHFASIKINWEDKITNIREIADEINIGLDSIIFIDDDKVNREVMKKALPEVCIVDLPSDSSLYVQTLAELNEFNTFQITDEDKKRGKTYVHQRKRQELQTATANISEFLRALNMKVTIKKADTFTMPRISQLTQRTNQFNMTTKRYSEEDIRAFVNNNFLVVSTSVEDKFGDNGMTGAAIVEKRNDKWRIDVFLLSCRVIGRRVEEVLLAYIIEQAKNEKIHRVIGEFIPTKKNIPAKDFYKNNGFRFLNESNILQIWEYVITGELAYPDFIKVVKED